MNRPFSMLTFAILLVGLSAISFAAGAATQAPASAKAQSEEVYKYLKPFTDVLAIIQEKYVDEDKTHTRDLIYGAIQGMVGTLDPFSQFMTPDEYKDMQTETSGKFGGLGIEIAIKDERLTVMTPIEGTPADKAGVRSGDKIIKIDGKPTDGMGINDAVKLLRGKVGTSVTVTLLREGLNEAFDVTLTRDVIKVQSVRSYRLPGDIGYVRVSEFIDNTTDDFVAAVEALQKQAPLKGLILDLRNDPGGLLNEAIGVSDYFTPSGKLIVSTKGRNADQTEEFKARDGEKFDPKKPVVVMVNGGSASGSEIVSGCLKDWKRAVLIGEKTFGKGSVQTILPLDDSDGAALRLTMAKYYTPSGVCIHGVGIEPDLDLRDENLTESTLKVYSKQDVEKYAQTLKKQGVTAALDRALPDKVVEGFFDYCLKNEKKLDRDELEKDKDYLKDSLTVELISDEKGEAEARQAAVLIDPQVAIAEQLINLDNKIPAALLAKYPPKKIDTSKEARLKKADDSEE
ncbi:MAG TPA: S41 family peptidase [bacterium]|nr:S41 family peptidase [bacterium]